MASHHKHGKGKNIDRTGPWSEYVWDNRGFWVASRYGYDGVEIEYDYRYPEKNIEPPTETAVQSAADPRTPGNTAKSLVSSSFNPENTPSVDTSASWTSTGGNSAYDRGSSQEATSSNYTTQAAYTPVTSSGQLGVTSNEQSFDSSALGTVSAVQYGSYGAAASSSGSNYMVPVAGPIPSAPAIGYSPAYGAAGISSGDNYASFETSLTQDFQSLSMGSPLPKIDEHAAQGNVQTLGNQVVKNIRRVPNSQYFEELDHRYQEVVDKDQKWFWKVGRVFMMLWTEPARTPIVPPGGGTRNGSHFSTTYLGGTAYSEIRRFVVIAEGHGNNICSPIHTYSGQATLKRNLPEPQQHAIIYTSKKPPDEKWYYAEDGETVIRENLNKDPIRVVREQTDDEGDLGQLSRINYSKIYTVENYVRVLNIGKVHQDSMETLINNAFVKPRKERPQKPRSHSGSKPSSKGNNQSSSSKSKDEDKDRDRDRDSRSSGRRRH